MMEINIHPTLTLPIWLDKESQNIVINHQLVTTKTLFPLEYPRISQCKLKTKNIDIKRN